MPTLEAQAVNLADSIAYDAHDMDDGLYSGLVSEEEVFNLPLSALVRERSGAGGLDFSAVESAAVRRKLLVRGLIDLLVSSTVETTQRRLDDTGIRSVDGVRRADGILVSLGDELLEPQKKHEEFLYDRMYKHYRVNRMMRKSTSFLKELFLAYVDAPEILPDAYRRQAEQTGDLYRVAADYIAGMTDRFAQEEYTRVFLPHERT